MYTAQCWEYQVHSFLTHNLVLSLFSQCWLLQVATAQWLLSNSTWLPEVLFTLVDNCSKRKCSNACNAGGGLEFSEAKDFASSIQLVKTEDQEPSANGDNSTAMDVEEEIVNAAPTPLPPPPASSGDGVPRSVFCLCSRPTSAV